MSIGGALAEARSDAGLSVTEVSERTRIRAAIIRDIERDDYAACGGDFYARGHIRAIAKVVGTDPVPLIAEYDAARMPNDDTDGVAEGLVPPPDAAAPADAVQASRPALPGGGDTEPIQPGPGFGQHELLTSASQRTRPAESGQPARAHLAESARAGVVRLGEAANAAASWLAARSERARASGLDRPGPRRGQRPRLTAVLALALAAAIALLLYLLISGSTGHSTAASRHSGVAARRHHGGSVTRHSAASPRQPSPGESQSVAALLTPASIAAFGPGGTRQADDPQSATLAIDGNPRTAWHTDWYTTPDFGRLQPGTGLLLDMGQPVAVSSVRLLFGPARGGAFQLRAGSSPALASMHPVAQAADPGGAVTVRITRPVRTRYLLVWLTRLPPNASGTCEAYIYSIAVSGTR